jgi:hypothetical protein
MIEWYPQGKQGHLKGYVGDMFLYFIYIGIPIMADVRDKSHSDWLNLDIPFSTVEEAKKWCETVEITGAYR